MESGILYLQHNRTNEKVTTYINEIYTLQLDGE